MPITNAAHAVVMLHMLHIQYCLLPILVEAPNVLQGQPYIEHVAIQMRSLWEHG